jgi:hypothetical protein
MSDETKAASSTVTSLQGRIDPIVRIAQRPIGKVYAVFVIFTLLNFFLFVAGSSYIGGDAVNGKISEGRYYVWGNHWSDAKGYREVSRSVFIYSRLHAYSVFISWSLMFISGIALEQMRRRQTS